MPEQVHTRKHQFQPMFSISSASMLLKSRCHFKTRFWTDNEFFPFLPLLQRNKPHCVSTSPSVPTLSGTSRFHLPRGQPPQVPQVPLKHEFSLAPATVLSAISSNHTPIKGNTWATTWTQLPLGQKASSKSPLYPHLSKAAPLVS